MIFRMLQAVVISVAFGLWIWYQLAVKKKTFKEIKNDVMAIVFFVAVWLGIYYWLIS